MYLDEEFFQEATYELNGSANIYVALPLNLYTVAAENYEFDVEDLFKVADVIACVNLYSITCCPPTLSVLVRGVKVILLFAACVLCGKIAKTKINIKFETIEKTFNLNIRSLNYYSKKNINGGFKYLTFTFFLLHPIFVIYSHSFKNMTYIFFYSFFTCFRLFSTSKI